MTAPAQTSQVPESKPTDKELNFRALEAKANRQLSEKDAEIKRLNEQLQERTKVVEDEEDDGEPYVDRKKLNKTLAKFGQDTQKNTEMTTKQAIKEALREERNAGWLARNPDFQQVMSLAGKLYEADPELAETILEMPESFERQKLVYKNIKNMRLDQPVVQEPSVQQKIDANRRSPFYQPSGVGTAPYQSKGDFSKSGQKSAYDKLQELKSTLRLG